jgi:hypothetical protein
MKLLPSVMPLYVLLEEMQNTRVATRKDDISHILTTKKGTYQPKRRLKMMTYK